MHSDILQTEPDDRFALARAFQQQSNILSICDFEIIFWIKGVKELIQADYFKWY